MPMVWCLMSHLIGELRKRSRSRDQSHSGERRRRRSKSPLPRTGRDRERRPRSRSRETFQSGREIGTQYLAPSWALSIAWFVLTVLVSRWVSSLSIYNCAHYFLPKPISPLDKTIDDLIKLKVSSSARPCRQCHCLETFPCRHLLLQLPYSLNIHRSWRSTRCHLIYSWAPSRSSGSKLSSIQASLHWKHHVKSWEKANNVRASQELTSGQLQGSQENSRNLGHQKSLPVVPHLRINPDTTISWRDCDWGIGSSHPLYPRSFPNSYPALPQCHCIQPFRMLLFTSTLTWCVSAKHHCQIRLIVL